MKPLRANSQLSTRGDRITGAWVFEPNLPAPHRAPAAGVDSSPASAAFLPFPDSCAGVAPAGQVRTAPIVPPLTTGAVVLSAHAMILLRSIAAYERCSNGHAVMLALVEYATKIGAGPLARAVFDENELAALADDLTAVPEHIRRGANRFRGGP